MLTRYSNEFISRLFNEVASNNKKDITQHVQNGGVVGSGVLANNYDVEDDWYDYSQGEYDPETDHWYSRNPETGLELKNEKHPTHFLEAEESAANELPR